MLNKKIFGNIGERIACRYLENLGYIIKERNFKCKQGEIDIIAIDKIKCEYVFIEVKTRKNNFYGKPRESVNEIKKRHIYNSAKYYLYIHRQNNVFVRFDIIEIYYLNSKYKLVHLKQVDIQY